MKNGGYVYILASRRNGTLYIGVTSDLVRRVYDHKHGSVEGFSRKYKTHNLVYYEIHERIDDAILREKQMKAWKRLWKLRLIESQNPDWEDLYGGILK
ncbi:Excinuclease ABC, C subunit-like [hydrothermal vent metagenome]|uniref:Excinuclease ABC, C subunit-like n=1 Tax=hydrothermal vent metagenome TaxID=652676 RepID=A0A3B0SPQ2_9ZZZZ